jgi:hypothetical protein
MNTAINAGVPKNAGNFLTSWGTVVLASQKRTLLHGVLYPPILLLLPFHWV